MDRFVQQNFNDFMIQMPLMKETSLFSFYMTDIQNSLKIKDQELINAKIVIPVGLEMHKWLIFKKNNKIFFEAETRGQ